MTTQFLPGLALLGAGIFVKDQYVGALRNLADVIELKYVWSRSAVRCSIPDAAWEGGLTFSCILKAGLNEYIAIHRGSELAL